MYPDVSEDAEHDGIGHFSYKVEYNAENWFIQTLALYYFVLIKTWEN